MIEEEIWKDIIGYEEKYQVSTEGNIRSLNYNNTKQIKLLKPKINRYGFREVKLSKNNKTKNFLIMTLVAITFIPNPQFKDEVMHISNNKQDDRVSNLKWAYKSETKHNMYNKGCRKKGKASKTKITFNGKKYKSYTDIARDYKLNLPTFYKRFYLLNWNLYEAIEIPIGGKENGN